MIAYLKWMVPLILLYIALTANAEPLNWLLGALVAFGVVVLIRPKSAQSSADFAPQWLNLPALLWAVFVFIITLFWDLAVSGIQVARLVLQAEPKIKQGIIAVPGATDKAWVTTMSAAAITLTPGEIVLEIGHDGTLYIHSLDVDKSQKNAAQDQVKRARQLEKMVL
jgi:multisubunit Na+/H+ antiporter MnhE subunit